MGIAMVIKRLHDRDRSGWFALIFLIPIVGAIWLFVEVICLAGTTGTNRFGLDPRQAITEETIDVSAQPLCRPVGARVLLAIVIALLASAYMLIVFGVYVVGHYLTNFGFGARLPVPTQLVFDITDYCKMLDWFGASLIVGFLAWHSIRTFRAITDEPQRERPMSRLWVILVCTVAFNAVVILSLALPFFSMGEGLKGLTEAFIGGTRVQPLVMRPSTTDVSVGIVTNSGERSLAVSIAFPHCAYAAAYDTYPRDSRLSLDKMVREGASPTIVVWRGITVDPEKRMINIAAEIQRFGLVDIHSGEEVQKTSRPDTTSTVTTNFPLRGVTSGSWALTIRVWNQPIAKATLAVRNSGDPETMSYDLSPLESFEERHY